MIEMAGDEKERTGEITDGEFRCGEKAELVGDSLGCERIGVNEAEAGEY